MQTHANEGFTSMLLTPTREFDRLLTTGAAWLLVGCACWAVLICAAAAVETLTLGRLRATTWVGCPPVLRQVMLAGLGVALIGAPGAATASSPVSRPTDGPGGPTASRRHELPAPARPLGPGRTGSTQVVVRPGDSLWRLAADRLRSPRPAAVAALVARTHHRNRDVIGPDPDLIRPGQRLVVPKTPRLQDPLRAEPTSRGEP